MNVDYDADDEDIADDDDEEEHEDNDDEDEEDEVDADDDDDVDVSVVDEEGEESAESEESDEDEDDDEEVDTEKEDEDVYELPTKRKRILNELLQLWNCVHRYRMALDDGDDFQSDFENIEYAILVEYFEIDSSRFLSRNIYRHDPKKITEFLQQQFERGKNAWWQPHEFKEEYRMTRTSFKMLHSMIKDHNVFKPSSSRRGKPQFSSKYQLLFLLHFLGTEGNGMSNRKARGKFPNGKGTCEKMKERVCTAIIDCCNDEAYFWPDEEERKNISHSFEKKYNVPHIVGISDGTLLPLAFKPCREDFPDFKGRKMLYTLSVMIINDHLLRIRYYHAGFPGNVHDERVYRNCDLAKNPDLYFDVMQFLVGDSAFTPRPTMVPVYKKAVGTILSQEKEKINTILSKPRVLSENTIGLFKGRWASMRSIRCRITKKKSSFRRVLRYIRVCVILHNLLIGWDDEYDREETDEYLSDIDADNELNRATPPDSGGDKRRDQLFNWCIENDIEPAASSKY